MDDHEIEKSNETLPEKEDRSLLKNISLRSGLTRDVLSQRTGFLEQWAIMTFLFLLTLVVIGSAFISYPEKVDSKAVIASDHRVLQISSAGRSVKLKLLVASGEKVIKNQAIGWIEEEDATNILPDTAGRQLLRAPESGRFFLTISLRYNESLKDKSVFGYISPLHPYFYVKLFLPQQGYSKVTVGQKVQVRIDTYPAQEFGFIEGRLTYKSEIPSDSGFVVYAELPENQRTNYLKTVNYVNGLTAKATILTSDKSLLQRFYYTITKDARSK